jgi:hypothetical protein
MKDKIITILKAIDREGMPDLIEWLAASDFFDAPASTRYHLAEPGGLAEHSWNVYNELGRLVRDWELPYFPYSISICGLLHDVCKVNFYKQDRKWTRLPNGKYDMNPCYKYEDNEPLGHGEKSVIIIQRFIKLELDEQLAIRWHMGAWDAESYIQRKQLSTAIERSRLTRAIIIADQIATFKESK